MKYKTEQENFWSGDFGENYINRNKGNKLLASNINFFSFSLKNISNISSCLELGANIGMNLKALKMLYPNTEFSGLEINTKAFEKLKTIIGDENAHLGSIFDFNTKNKYDLILIKGVLIHLNPKMLSTVYEKLFDFSNKYILIAEYYNRTPVTIEYRGHKNRLFKRDFAGELKDKFPELTLIDYGFCYHKDPKFPQDDISWFLFQK
jgi:pseudaminic acid biosynthesis-associated methylase